MSQIQVTVPAAPAQRIDLARMRTPALPNPLSLLVPAACALLAMAPAVGDEQAYADAMQAQMYAEAETVAKAALAEALQAGTRDLATAALYVDLGHAQRLGGQPVAAARNFEAAIEIVEENTDMLHVALEAPLRGAAHAYADAGVPEAAIPALERAVHVRQVNSGPHAPEQVESLQQLAQVQLALAQDEAVLATGRRIAYLLRRQGDAGENTVPAWLQLGRLYGAGENFEEERESYRAALSLLARQPGDTIRHRVEAHAGIGESFYNEYFADFHAAGSEEELPGTDALGEARRQLATAVEISGENAAADWRARARALLALGDFMTLLDQAGEARRAYREAWGVLSAADDRLEMRRSELEQVSPLLQPTPNRARIARAMRDDADGASAPTEILVTFVVNRRGRLANVSSTGTRIDDDAGLADDFRDDLGRFVYRPRMQNGLIVTTVDVPYRYPLDGRSVPPR